MRKKESELTKKCAFADSEMESILREMLDSDQDITARAVAKKHPTLSAASSITRIDQRRHVLEKYQEEQRARRAWRDRLPKQNKSDLIAQLSKYEQKMAALKSENLALITSHQIMLRAVGESGAMKKLLELYEQYRYIREELEKMGLVSRGEVVSMPRT